MACARSLQGNILAMFLDGTLSCFFTPAQELEEQWDDKAMKRFIAQGDEEPSVATDGKEHVVLIANDSITGEILGCVEARAMQGYLRPKSIPVIASDDAQQVSL
eukprot:5043654-Pyramimonas_sp.AAC.1